MLKRPDKVLIEKSGNIVVLFLNSPQTGNAVDRDLGEALLFSLETLEKDDDIRVVILTGRGRHFSAGADVRAMKAELEKAPFITPSAVLAEYTGYFIRAAAVIRNMDKIVIAAVNGTAAGGGLALALSCDLILAADDAVFDPAYVRLGLVPVCGLSALLPQLVGRFLAAEFLMLARPVDAEKACSLRMVNRVVEKEHLDKEAAALAAALAGQSATALAETKKLLRQAAPEMDAVREQEAASSGICSKTAEHTSRLNALIRSLNG